MEKKNHRQYVGQDVYSEQYTVNISICLDLDFVCVGSHNTTPLLCLVMQYHFITKGMFYTNTYSSFNHSTT